MSRYLGSYTILWRWKQNFSIDLKVEGEDLTDYKVIFQIDKNDKQSFIATSDDVLELDTDQGTVQATLNADSKPSDESITFSDLEPGKYDYKFDFCKFDSKAFKHYSNFNLQGTFQVENDTGRITQARPAVVGATLTLSASDGFIATITVQGWDEPRINDIEAKNTEQDGRIAALEQRPIGIPDTTSTTAQIRVKGAWQDGYNKAQIDASQSAQNTNISTNQSDIATNKANITTNTNKNTEQDGRLTALEQQAHEGFTPVGVWNADTNVPDLVNIDPTPSNGNYWLVEVAGTTPLNNHTDWEVGDWAIWLADVPGNWEQYRPPNSAQQDIDAHKLDEGNPHGVTAAQTGADPVGSADAVDSRLTTEVTRLDAKDAAQDTALTTHADDSAIHWNESRIAALESAVSALQSDLASHAGNGLIHFVDVANNGQIYSRKNRAWLQPDFVSINNPGSMAVDTGTNILQNYSGSDVRGTGFTGNYDQAAGTITIPETGLYNVTCTFAGSRSSDNKELDYSLYIRVAGDGDYLLDVREMATDKVDQVAVSGVFSGQFTGGEVLSLFMTTSESTLGTVVFSSGVFQVAVV